MLRIEKKLLEAITDIDNERNIYTHNLALARDIFWQRLEYAYVYLKEYTSKKDNVLDFGGGSGVFSKATTQYYDNVSIIDIDTNDAQNIKNHFKIKNLNIITCDINTYSDRQTYDVSIATDVLELFHDLNEPLKFFQKHLIHDGLLLVTLPTENIIYELGRFIIRKTKPQDHYHKSKEVLDFLGNNGFYILQKEFIPKYIVSIPLFEVAILKFKG